MYAMSDSTAIMDSRQEAGPVALATLAKQINDHHRQCESVMNAGLRHALEAGRLLAEASGRP